MSDACGLSATTSATIETVFHLYDPPVWLVSAAHGSRRGGCIVTSAMRASIVPERPRMLLAIARHHHTWSLIEASGRCALHLLHDTDPEAVWRFGLASGHQTDKFIDYPDHRTPGGSPKYEHALAWFDCRIEQQMPIGDRSVYLAAIEDAAVAAQGMPLSVRSLMEQAPPAQRAELKRLYTEDQQIDLQAIDTWRARRGQD